MVWLQNDLYLATLPPPGKSKWRPQSRDFVCFSILTTYKLHISAPIADSNTIVTATPIFGVQQLNDTIVHCTWHKGVQKFKMAAYKPEVLISQLVDEIETPFQELPLIFRVEQLNSTIVQHTRHKGSPEIQDGGLQTGSTYISACRRDRKAMSRAIPPFSG